jgi:uncharacterized protein YqcC (DUF446 family)
MYTLEGMSLYPDDPSQAVIERREALFALFTQRRYDEAADYALKLAMDVTLFSPLEAIADQINKDRPADAVKLYTAALANEREYASWATGGGEGLSRMVAVRRLEAKLSSDLHQSFSAKPQTPKDSVGDEKFRAPFESVEEALVFLSHHLRQDKIDDLFRACVSPGERAVFEETVRQLKTIDQKTPLPKLYGRQVFPAKRSTLKIGGHSSKWGHVYVAFIKANNQWMLQGISSCCALNSNPRAEARVGKVDPRKVSRALQTIVRTMKEENLWDVSRPNEEAFINMGAYGQRTMAFGQWLRWVFVPNVEALVASQGPWPIRSWVAAIARREGETDRKIRLVVDSLVAFDRLFDP